MKRIISIFFAAACLVTGTWAKSNIQVETSPRIVLGKAFDVVYWADGNGQQISLKANDQFKIAAGPYRYAENYTVREKGRLVIRTRTAFSYRMVPMVSGEVKLPKAKVKLSKGSVTSKAVKIHVQEPRSIDPMGFGMFDMWFDEPEFPMPSFPCERHHGSHPGHHGHGPCPHHEIHMDTISFEHVDTTGCELAICAPDSATEGKDFTVKYFISAKADSIVLNDTTDFEIVSGPFYGTQTSVSIINGKRQPDRFEQSFSYILRARKAGELRLPKAEVWIGNTRKSSVEKTISIQSK